MRRPFFTRTDSIVGCLAVMMCVPSTAQAVSSAELYTPMAYQYGRMEARIQFAAGDGVVSSFFLWKDGSELSDVYWNELDFEKLWADCHLETNALHGNPEMSHNQGYDSDADLCGGFHTYAYEWTPDYIAWLIDGVEIRREEGETAQAFAENASAGMQIRFNVWPGDESFGGNFDPAILPVHQYINWVQYSSYANGAFQFEWREDFSANALPSGWLTANWSSPKNLSTHTPANINFLDGYAVLSLTADDATGPTGAMPMDEEDDEPPLGSGGTAGTVGSGGTSGGTTNEPRGGSSGEASGGDGGTQSEPGGVGGVVGVAGMGADDPIEPSASSSGGEGEPSPPASSGNEPANDGTSAPNPAAPSQAEPNESNEPNMNPMTPVNVAPSLAGGATSPSVDDMPSNTGGSGPVLNDGAAGGGEGCGCRVFGTGPHGTSAWLVIGLAGWLFTWRRRAARERVAAVHRSRISEFAVRVRGSNALRSAICLAAVLMCTPSVARAVSSAELYTSTPYQYGRMEARIQFAAGDGVVSSFFLWKDGSEMADVYWNELDFEKLEAECHLETNALYGSPEMSHNQGYDSDADFCGDFHTYAYEWTPDYIAWSIDGVEVRREEGEAAQAFAENAEMGMQIRFNIWPGDASFGGNFDPAILPVHQYINWVQYSSYADGAFLLEWREDFSAPTRPSGWATGSWGSPKNLSTHTPANVNFVEGYAVLSLTADDATGAAGATPMDPSGNEPPLGPAPTPAPSGSAGGPSIDDDTTGNGEGCGCRVAGNSVRRGSTWLALGLGCLVLSWRRRRRGGLATSHSCSERRVEHR